MSRAVGLMIVLAAAVLALAAFQPQARDAGAEEKPPVAPATPPAGMPPATPPGMPGGSPAGMPRGPVGPPMFAPLASDSFVAERDSITNDLLQRIAGHENAPAESVFKNIKSMKGTPAGRLLRIMNFGYGRGLGVRCQHCHVPGKWADEDKQQKQIARDMGEMLKTINTQLLPGIKNLKSEHPGINCTTCHRGQVKPAQNM